jgi:hypothetical protein
VATPLGNQLNVPLKWTCTNKKDKFIKILNVNTLTPIQSKLILGDKDIQGYTEIYKGTTDPEDI